MEVLKHQRLSLWSYLYKLLEEDKNHSMITWIDKTKLIFKIQDGHKLAKTWGRKKGRENMTYAKFTRALRYYHGKNIIEKIPGFKRTYQFFISDKTSHILPTQDLLFRRQSSSLVEDVFNNIDARLIDVLMSQNSLNCKDFNDVTYKTTNCYFEWHKDKLVSQDLGYNRCMISQTEQDRLLNYEKPYGFYHSSDRDNTYDSKHDLFQPINNNIVEKEEFETKQDDVFLHSIFNYDDSMISEHANVLVNPSFRVNNRLNI